MEYEYVRSDVIYMGRKHNTFNLTIGNLLRQNVMIGKQYEVCHFKNKRKGLVGSFRFFESGYQKNFLYLIITIVILSE